MADKKKNEQGEETKTYVLKAGSKMFYNGQNVGAGTEVELTDTQARAFRDKVDLKGEKPSFVTPAAEPPKADGSESGAGAVGPSHVPQDIGATIQTVDTNVGNHRPIGGVGAKTAPGSSAANTSMATGSPLSPPPPGDVVPGSTAPKKGTETK